MLGAATAALSAWALGHLAWPVWPATPVGLAVAAGWAVAVGAAPAGALAWDGQAWRLDEEVGALRAMIDLDGLLLLRFAPAGRGWRARRWLLLRRPAADQGRAAAWHGLRAALYSRPPAATPGAPPDSPGPPARPD